MLRRVWAISQKELILTLRDRATLIIIIAIPLLQLFLFAYAIHMDVRHVPMVVADQSLDSYSRSYLSAMVSSSYFDIVATVPSQREVIRAIDEGKARIGVVIPPHFASNIRRNQAQVLLIVDGSDPFPTLSAYRSAGAIAQQYTVDLFLEKLRQSNISSPEQLNPLTAQIRILYNPDQNDLWFLIPGMIAMLLQTQTITLTAFAVVREREAGTIEALLITPLRPLELMLGKTIPNLGLAIIDMIMIVAMGTAGFDVPFQGNFLMFLILAILYAVCGLGLGLLISAISNNQGQAQQLTLMFTLIGQLLSGFIFPRYAMPAILSLIGYVFPLTYFIPIARGMFTKGIGVEFLWQQVLAIVAFVMVILFFAVRSFRQRLD